MVEHVWECYVDFGAGSVDITEHCSEFARQFVAHNDLKMATNVARFVVDDRATFNLFMTAGNDIPVTIIKDDGYWFVGKAKVNFSGRVTSATETLTVECVDYTNDLRKTIDETFAWSGYKVCDTTTPASSIVHQLLVSAGFSLGDMSLTDIDVTLTVYSVGREESKTFWDELSTIMFEYGYVLDVTAAGVFVMRDLHPTSLSSGLLRDDQLGQPMGIKRSRAKWEAARVTWYPIVTFSDVMVFADRTGGDDTNPMNVDLASGEYYPDGASASDPVYSVYNYDDAEILNVENESLVWSYSGTVTLEEETYGVKRADIRFKGGAGGGSLIQYEIWGDATALDKTKIHKEVVYNVAGTDRILEYTCRFIISEVYGQLLASNLVNYYNYAKVQYDCEVIDDDLSIGLLDAFDLESDAQNIDVGVRVVQIKEDEWGKRWVVMEGITAYSLLSAESQSVINAPTVIRPIEDVSTFDGPTYSEIIDGFSSAVGTGVTTVPTVPTVTIEPVHRGFILRWDRQVNLSNFDRYEVQVSNDDATWYDLEFDGSDWKGTAGLDTDWGTEILVHAHLPFDGTEDAPTALTLYYRVRRVTKLAVASAWSTSVTTTNLLIDTGDIAANAISANKVATGFLQALFAEISTLAVGYIGSGTYSSPSEGDLVLLIDDAVMKLQQRIDGAWVDEGLSVGVVVGSLVSSLFQSYGLVHPNVDTDNIPIEPLPSSNFDWATYETDMDSIKGVSPTATASRSSAWAKFGTYSAFDGSIKYTDLIVLGQDITTAAWYNIVEVPVIGTSMSPILLYYNVDSDNYLHWLCNYNPYSQQFTCTLSEKVSGSLIQTVTITMAITPANFAGEHFIGMVLDVTNSKIKLVFDDQSDEASFATLTLTGDATEGSDFNNITFMSYNATGVQGINYVDETLFCFNEAMSTERLIKHYHANQPWYTGAAIEKDVLIIPEDGGTTRFPVGNMNLADAVSIEYNSTDDSLDVVFT